MSAPPAVELRGITKRFGGILANDGVNLAVVRGTIHGIVGENGAGKSTAMKILYGMYRPDAGEILLDGQRCAWTSPAQAIARGLGMVHQHFMLAGAHSVLDNILLGAEPGRLGLVDRQAARTRVQSLASQYGQSIDWQRPVEELPVGMQQRVEILKLLYREAQVLILDEPTAVLTPLETHALFESLQRLREQGKTILLVTHKLKEVMAGTDHVTVLRDGRVVGASATSGTNPRELARLMVGRDVALNFSVAPAVASAETGLSVDGLTIAGMDGGRHRLTDVTFKVQRGEIVGIAGVEGNGQSELLRALLHPAERERRVGGTIRMLGHEVTDWPAARIRELGVALIPEDRLREGLLPQRPAFENFLLGLHRAAPFSTRGWLNLRRARASAAAALQTYGVRPVNLEAAADTFSGGNQQKLIVAREFEREPRILIAAQPTRGVDVGAIEFIHRRIVQARDTGAAILLVSSELDEILTLSDRILVMYEGRVTAQFRRGQVTERDLGLRMGGL